MLYRIISINSDGSVRLMENKKNSENKDVEISVTRQNDDEFCEFTENSEKYAVLICDDPTDNDKKMTISGISFLSGVAF